MWIIGTLWGEPVCSIDDPRYNEFFGIQHEKCKK